MTKAREVFLLFRRTEQLNKEIKKHQKKEENKNIKKNDEAVDVTGQYGTWW